MKLAAIVLAAGASRRMGAAKALLPLGRETMLARCLRLFREAGTDEVIVVAGHQAGPVAGEAVAHGATPVVNAAHRQGMFTSVLAGIAALPKDSDAFFLLPADIPLVRPAVLAALARAHEAACGAVLALRPSFRGRPGHPPLIGRQAIPAITGHDGQGGLARALDGLGGGLADVPVCDQGILFDIDTPGDYQTALDRLDNLDIPSPAECAALLSGMNRRGREHARAVAALALTLARAVGARRAPGEELNLELIRASALLHDIAKGTPGHEPEGGRILAAWGFSRTAAIVAAHRDPVPEPYGPVTERELVALADKLVKGSRRVSIEERFGEKMSLYAGDRDALEGIGRRLANARAVKARIEAQTGRDIYELLTIRT